MLAFQGSTSVCALCSREVLYCLHLTILPLCAHKVGQEHGLSDKDRSRACSRRAMRIRKSTLAGQIGRYKIPFPFLEIVTMKYMHSQLSLPVSCGFQRPMPSS